MEKRVIKEMFALGAIYILLMFAWIIVFEVFYWKEIHWLGDVLVGVIGALVYTTGICVWAIRDYWREAE
jgi:inner membrane protein involved in colicin E2 resistance